MLRSSTLALLLLTAMPATAQEAPSTEAAAEATAPTALMPRQERMLREGRGMGLARAAELNGFPGPRHVLEQAETLELSDEQRAATALLVARVREQAPALGARIVQAEAELNALFAERRVSPDAMNAKLAEIAELNARLRAVHLQAHIDQTAILNEAQRAAYQPAHQRSGGRHGAGQQERRQERHQNRAGAGQHGEG